MIIENVSELRRMLGKKNQQAKSASNLGILPVPQLLLCSLTIITINHASPLPRPFPQQADAIRLCRSISTWISDAASVNLRTEQQKNWYDEQFMTSVQVGGVVAELRLYVKKNSITIGISAYSAFANGIKCKRRIKCIRLWCVIVCNHLKVQ